MTVFGKILVFLNLLFSVVTGALIVFVFTTRSNWVAAYNDAKTKAEAAETAYRTEKASHDNDRKSAEQTLGTVNEQTGPAGQAALGHPGGQRAAPHQRRRPDQPEEHGRQQQPKAPGRAGPEQVRAGGPGGRTEHLQSRIVGMQQEVDKWRTTAVTADLQAKNLVQRVNNLLRQVEDLTARNRELEAAAPGGGGGAAPAGRRWPRSRPRPPRPASAAR